MGIYYTTKSHYDFSASLNEGDFLSADFTSDGDWDHMAYVTQTARYRPEYNYYDYRVAQHTSDYLEWTTSSKNNWEDIGNDGGTYARIRR